MRDWFIMGRLFFRSLRFNERLIPSVVSFECSLVIAKFAAMALSSLFSKYVCLIELTFELLLAIYTLGILEFRGVCAFLRVRRLHSARKLFFHNYEKHFPHF